MKLLGRGGPTASGTRTVLDGRWMLPGELALLDSDRPRRRTTRDWAVDLALFGSAVAFGLDELSQSGPGWLHVNLWLGLAGCLALWWRRRFPLPLVWALLPTMILAGAAGGAAIVAILTLAVHRNWPVAVASTAPYVLVVAPYAYHFPSADATALESALLTSAMFVMPLTIGIAVRSRRQLVVSLHRAAERERREHQLRLADARRAERERIAREMHDVLAHRISLLSMHAGGLAYRTAQARSGGAGAPLDPNEVDDAVTVIRDNADHALTELRDVLAVLRAVDPAEADVRRPQPDLSRLDDLINEARDAGQDVRLDVAVTDDELGGLRPSARRTAYRVVQEGLTNARKHAPGATVDVAVSGGRDDGLEIWIANRLTGTDDPTPLGAGVGLAGLAERVSLEAGELEHGVEHGVEDELFVLRAHLPWSDERAGEPT